MEKNIEKISNVEILINVTLSEEEIMPKLDSAYQKAQATIEIKGFRKGKVPLNIIKNRFGQEIEREALYEIITETTDKILNEDGNNSFGKSIGQPVVTNYKYENNQLSFTISVEIVPEFELQDYHNLEIEEPIHRVTEEEIEDTIEQILLSRAEITPTDEVADKNTFVKLTLHKCDENSIVLLDQPPQELSIVLSDRRLSEEFLQSILGKKLNETYIFTKNIATQQENTPISITIKEIYTIKKPELTNEFVQEYSQKRLNSIEELRQEIEFKLQEEWDKASREKLENNLIEKLIEINSFEVPPRYCNYITYEFYKDLQKSEGREPNIEEFNKIKDSLQPIGEKLVKWQIIKDKIIEKEKIEVEDYDFEDFASTYLNAKGENIPLIASYLKENENYHYRILNKKLIDLLLDFSITKEVEFNKGEK